MKHYLLLKLMPQADPVGIKEKLWKTCRELDEELDWLSHPVVWRACREDDDFDLMAVLEIDGEAHLAEFRAHPLVKKLEGKIAGLVKRYEAFDHY